MGRRAVGRRGVRGRRSVRRSRWGGLLTGLLGGAWSAAVSGNGAGQTRL